MISKEEKEKNYQLFIKRLSKLGIDTNEIDKNYGEMIMNGSFTISNEYGNAYEGSFLEIVLKTLTPYAVRINELLPSELQVNKDVLVKICLLHQLAKCIRLIPNDNSWEIEKRNLTYKYNNNLPSIRTGLHSLVLCQRCGIDFTESEAEAMTVNDRELGDEQSRYHSSIMANIVRQASELTYLTINS